MTQEAVPYMEYWDTAGLESHQLTLAAGPRGPDGRRLLGAAAKLSHFHAPRKSHDRHESHDPTSSSQRHQQFTPIQEQVLAEPFERLSTPSSHHRVLRRTPRFEATPSPEPRRVHIAAASLGFVPRALSFEERVAESRPVPGLEPALPIRRRQDLISRHVLSQELGDDIDEESTEQRTRSVRSSALATSRPEPHRALRISKRTHDAILYALEEALRHPYSFTPEEAEESANMADLMSGGVPVTSNGNGLASPRRPTAAPAPTGSPIRTPREIMKAREARQREQDQLRVEGERAEKERIRAEQERIRVEQERQERLRSEQEARRSREERQLNPSRRGHGQSGGSGGGGTNTRQEADFGQHGQDVPIPSQQPQPQTHHSARNPSVDEPAAQASGSSRPRNSFPHAFERWETLSAHWEGLTSYWIRKLEQNSNEINRDPVSQQLARQVTDLSAAGANLFHAVVELQRLRASSERKFQRWFFETRAELERAQEVNARLKDALEKERREQSEAIQNAVERERGASKAQQQLAEMRRELAISKEEARRAWEELGRREQEERDRTLSLQSGHPTIVGGVQVVPMTQGLPSRQGGSSRDQGGYQPEYAASYTSSQSRTQPAQPAATTTTASAGASDPYYRAQEPSQQPGQQQGGSHGRRGSEGGYSEGEYVVDVQGNFVLDARGNKIPFFAPPSTISASDLDPEEDETPATANPPNDGLQVPPTTSAPPGQWTGAYSNTTDYSGQGFPAPGWETVPRHHHPTRLSDVIEEEDERSRTSASQVSRG